MRFEKPIVLLLIVFTVYLSYNALLPTYKNDTDAEPTTFSTDRAYTHVKSIGAQPHAVGFPNHHIVRDYVVRELQKMGLEVSLQDGYSLSDWGSLCKVSNVLARIKGAEAGKALLLLTHYDSSPHSSFGASDAGSGVATILEGVRAFLATNKTPKNDIIILISDAEELGLNGAELFVNQHKWAKEVGLVLNFEARGSGGPSYMLIETNKGNSKLIEAFAEANSENPVANSLAYSIYKLLPNDTDLTVFREDGNIEGFNFAFIDDHYDYHTALDIPERLDLNTLKHQGAYLMPLLQYFSEADLNQTKSDTDHVYFNIPFFDFVYYPFSWMWPLFGIAVLAFLVVVIIGFSNKAIHIKLIIKGAIPMFMALITNGVIGYFGWQVLTSWYPQYQDILHGFPYNGHTYIFAFVFLALSLCYLFYNRFYSVSTPNLLVAPIFIWLVICGLINYYLPGASFFIIPVFGLIAALLICIQPERPNLFILFFLSVSAIFIFSPLIKMLPVGLGLKMIAGTTLLTTLLFLLVLPVLHQVQNMTRLASLFLILAVAFGIMAHNEADYTGESPKPSSLLYVYDSDKDVARWASYDKVMLEWNQQFMGAVDTIDQNKYALSSKYGTRLVYGAKAPKKALLAPNFSILKDTVINDERQVQFKITHNRMVNRLDVYTNALPLKKALVNGIPLSKKLLKKRKERLVTHHISENDSTLIDVVFAKDQKLEITLMEASNDLLTNEQFSIPPRPVSSIPMPFVLNDAIIIKKKVTID